MLMSQVRHILRKFGRLKTTSAAELPHKIGGRGYGYITPSQEIFRPVPTLFPIFKRNILDAVSIGNGFVVGAYQGPKGHMLSSFGVNKTLQLGGPGVSGNSQILFDSRSWCVDDGIVKLRSGRAHTLALSESGVVHVWGANNMGQLGQGSTSSVPFSTLDIENVQDVCTSLDTSFLLLKDGSVLSAGWAADGQTGSGDTTMLITFTLINLPHPVSQISSSGDSTLVRCDNGAVYGWGNNEHHQVSPSTEMQVVSPTLMDMPEPMVQVAAGGSFSLFLSRSGNLYSCGYGPGTGISPNIVVPELSHVVCSHSVSFITSSLDHAAAITADAWIMRWGRGQHHKLISASDDDMITPEVIDVPCKVNNIVCGPVRTCIIVNKPINSLESLGMIEDGCEETEFA